MQKINLKQRIIGAIVLLALAVIFLPMLLQESGGTKISLQKIPSRPTAPVVKAPTQTPIQMPAVQLQNPVQAAKPAAPAWSLQLGAFANEKNANALLKRLQKAGYPAYIQIQNGQAGKIMRVYIGPELERAKLEQEASALAQKMQIKGKIVPFKAINTRLQAEK